ncbi:MAG TPA: hypothetical protein VII73_04215 [Caulobacteraceae bacterium]
MPAHPAAPPAATGLPQFDPHWWLGQIVWLLAIFAVVFLLMRHVFVPRIGGTILARERKIEGDIAAARALKAEADALAKTAAGEMAEARLAARRVAAGARDEARAEIDAALAKEDAALEASLTAAEARIDEAREAAMTGVRGIAAEAAAAIVEKLTGRPASAAETQSALAGAGG